MSLNRQPMAYMYAIFRELNITQHIVTIDSIVLFSCILVHCKKLAYLPNNFVNLHVFIKSSLLICN